MYCNAVNRGDQVLTAHADTEAQAGNAMGIMKPRSDGAPPMSTTVLHMGNPGVWPVTIAKH
jgi:hypothetical protein